MNTLSIQPLNEQLNEPGCAFKNRDAQFEDYPVLITGIRGTRLRVNHRNITLKLKPGQETKQDDYLFQAAGYQLQLHYGPRSEESETSSAYNQAQLIIQYKNQTLKVDVKGDCGA